MNAVSWKEKCQEQLIVWTNWDFRGGSCILNNLSVVGVSRFPFSLSQCSALDKSKLQSNIIYGKQQPKAVYILMTCWGSSYHNFWCEVDNKSLVYIGTIKGPFIKAALYSFRRFFFTLNDSIRQHLKAFIPENFDKPSAARDAKCALHNGRLWDSFIAKVVSSNTYLKK